MVAIRVRLATAAAAFLCLLGLVTAASAQPATPLFNRLGCGACHGAPGAGGRAGAGDLLSSPVPRMQDGGAALYDFMRNAEQGHPDLKRPRPGMVIAQLTQAQARDLVAELRARWDAVRGQRGRADAPAIVAASGAPCKVSDALYMPVSVDRKKTQVEAYELACEGAVGRVVLKTTAGGKASYEVRDCLLTSAPRADGKPDLLACVLPANQDVKAQLGPYLAAAAVPCDLKQARSLGSSQEGVYIEAACAGDRGYLLTLPASLEASGVEALNCLVFRPGAAVECKLTDREAMLAAATAPLARAADPGCDVKERRFVLTNKGDAYYEVACGSGAGFIVAADAKGAFKLKVDCDNAGGIDGGCKLTDGQTIQTADNALYTSRARSAGYDCAVSGYRLVASEGQGRTVEVACGNRPDGAIAVLPGTGAARFFNCAAAATTGFQCRLTKADAAYGQLTAAVKKAHPTSTCQVSASKFLGTTADGGFVEVTCADRQPGYVVQYAKATAAPTDVIYCSRLNAQSGVTCGLPGNGRN